MMSDLIFVPTYPDPVMSFQSGIDEGHADLQQSLKQVVGHLPPALLKIVAEDLGRFERSEPVSSLTTEVFKRAISAYQSAQLSNIANPKSIMAS
ncbi:hypothetical protein ROA7450_02316 [Roseovarius albus]|uniref:Uncharacterized protein n=2 Tax=Roseovarius albus TaxID=1247867 RepID=A0A1X6ZCF2_9RHOB|nr:hypothetical protein ROA7450_02316 [Roseovarius albus]